MTPDQRQQIETQIKSDFSELQKKLEELQNEVKNEGDEKKKHEKQAEYQKLLEELKVIEQDMKNIESRNEEEVLALKNKLESTKKTYQETQWELADLAGETQELAEKNQEAHPVPTTYELLKDSETCSRLLNIISTNPKEFKNVPWDTPEAKLEYIFSKIRNSIVLFMKNKLWDSEQCKEVINNTIAPAFERSLMELLRDQWNENNVSMLQWLNKISWGSFNKLVSWVSNFAQKATWSYDKFSQWMNAVDYLSVHNWVLCERNHSKVLSNPLEFQKYMNDARFKSSGFSPYTAIPDNIFKINENQTFEFGVSLQEKQWILQRIWNIQVVNNPKTTALITKMLNKPEKFLWATAWLQKTANSLLDGVNSVNSVTKIFWIDLLEEITRVPEERSFLFKVIDFVCKLIWITWWLEWIVKRWRLDRMNLTDAKNENISQIFKKYKELAWENTSLNITDADSCKKALNDFTVTDPQNDSSTKWDFLRDSIVEKMDVSLISPAVVQQAVEEHKLWNSLDYYLKKETIYGKDWKSREIFVVDKSKFTEDDKLELTHNHLNNMKLHLENYNDLKDFYANIHSTEDIALCITASLYADENDVIEWVKAKVFLPENYGAFRYNWTVVDTNTNWWTSWWIGHWNNTWWRENLDSAESADKQKVSEQWVYDKAVEYGVTDKRQIAYILSTIKWECSFKNQKEIKTEKTKDKEYWRVDWNTWKAYYGRWFIQLTWKNNYQKYTQIIKDMWKDFKDNDGNIIKSSDIDLVNNPDIILNSNELAIFIAIHWMKNGNFTWKKLDDFINGTKTDFYKARSIVNWMSSKPQEYANDALAYQNKLWKWTIDSPIERNDLLIWPHLLARNKDEIWWLWNSIMNWFQWLNSKTNFPNMDWAEWKSTVTHPNRFNSQDDVLAYKNTHPKVKSFMFYFWANTRDNNRTLSDIKKWSEWLQSEWIQPVLCTCVWEDKQTWLKELNKNLISLWREKNRPVLDFAKAYSKWDIALSSDWVHPKSYSPMTDIINGQLSQA